MRQYLPLWKIKAKINFEVQKLKENIMMTFGIYNEYLIVFDGGLGSQILSYFQYEYLLREGNYPHVNIEYYREDNAEFDANLEYRKWSLDRYGICLKDFYNNKAKRSKSYSKVPTNLMVKKDINYFAKLRNLDLREVLPINYNDVSCFLEHHGVFTDYYAVHIRRGDYLTAASLIVSDEEILNLVQNILPNFIKYPIFVFSDSQISKKIVNSLNQIGYRQIILCGTDTTDQFLTHDLMRNAKILITSNSTFSLSAGLLARDNQITIIPTKFYSGYRDAPANLLINELSNFSILSRNFELE